MLVTTCFATWSATTAASATADRAVSLADASAQKAVYLPLTLLRRSQLELQMRLWEPARADAARALDLYKAMIGPGMFSNKIGRCYVVMGRALAQQDKADEARVAFAAALENLEPSQGADHPETRRVQQLAASLAAKR